MKNENTKQPSSIIMLLCTILFMIMLFIGIPYFSTKIDEKKLDGLKSVSEGTYSCNANTSIGKVSFQFEKMFKKSENGKHTIEASNYLVTR